MALGFQIVSADSHVVEPPDLWLKRIGRKYRDRVPRIVREADSDYFVCEGVVGRGGETQKMAIGPFGAPVRKEKGKDPKAHDFRMAGRFEDVPAGAYDPTVRLKDLETRGIEAEVIYASLGLVMYSIHDLDFELACFQAFNDWMVDFCAAAPKRLFGIAMLPTEPIERAVAEITRCAKMGLRGAMISINQEVGRGYENPMYDPLWSAAEDLSIPISLHVAASKTSFNFTANTIVNTTLAFTPVMYTVTGMIVSGLFDRHRKLKVASVENDAAWAVAMLERLDDRYECDRGSIAISDAGITSGRRPSDIFREHVACTFIRDNSAVFNRHRIGIKNLMWGSDYPHFDGGWQDPVRVLGEQFVEVPEEDQVRIGRRNAIEFYGLPLTP